MTVFERVKALNLPADQYVVVGGAMEAHGIRNALDIDLVVTPQLFERLLAEGWEHNPSKPGDIGRYGTKRKLKRNDVSIMSEYSWLDKYFLDTSVLMATAD